MDNTIRMYYFSDYPPIRYVDDGGNCRMDMYTTAYSSKNKKMTEEKWAAYLEWAAIEMIEIAKGRPTTICI